MKRGWKLGLALILILTVATAVIWSRLPQTHDLNRLAKPVPGIAYQHVNDYFWRDGSHLLAFGYRSGGSNPPL